MNIFSLRRGFSPFPLTWAAWRNDLSQFFRSEESSENDDMLRRSLGQLALVRVLIISAILAVSGRTM